MIEIKDNSAENSHTKTITVPDVNKKKHASSSTKDGKPTWEYIRDQHRQKVKGMFKFYEVPGGELSFVFLEFKGDPVQYYSLKDGEIYEIPLGVARHLNKNGWYPVHAHEQDPTGKVSVRVGQKVRRFGFQSLEFIDEIDLGEVGNVLTVQQM